VRFWRLLGFEEIAAAALAAPPASRGSQRGRHPDPHHPRSRIRPPDGGGGTSPCRRARLRHEPAHAGATRASEPGGAGNQRPLGTPRRVCSCTSRAATSSRSCPSPPLPPLARRVRGPLLHVRGEPGRTGSILPMGGAAREAPTIRGVSPLRATAAGRSPRGGAGWGGRRPSPREYRAMGLARHQHPVRSAAASSWPSCRPALEEAAPVARPFDRVSWAGESGVGKDAAASASSSTGGRAAAGGAAAVLTGELRRAGGRASCPTPRIGPPPCGPLARAGDPALERAVAVRPRAGLAHMLPGLGGGAAGPAPRSSASTAAGAVVRGPARAVRAARRRRRPAADDRGPALGPIALDPRVPRSTSRSSLVAGAEAARVRGRQATGPDELHRRHPAAGPAASPRLESRHERTPPSRLLRLTHGGAGASKLADILGAGAGARACSTGCSTARGNPAVSPRSCSPPDWNGRGALPP